MPTTKKKPAPKKAEPAETPKPKKGERPVENAELEVLKFWTDPADKDCKGPMTQDVIRGILGWEEETEEVKFGADFLFKDRRGNKVRCTRNLKNRGLEWPQVENLVQTHLNRRWAGPTCMPGKTVNGETIIVDKYGDLHQGQHTLIAAVIAEQDRTETDAAGNLTADAKHWQTKWPTEVTVDKLVVIGIDGSDDVVNTIDTGRPRRLEDVIYRSETFAKLPPADRKTAARMLSVAVRLIWDRCQMKANAWAPILNHVEALEFANNHKRLAKAVHHILTENSGANRIGQWVNPGVAAGLMYLMAASDADGDKYRKADEPHERRAGITEDSWKRAEKFWTLLPDGKELQEARYAFAYARDTSTGMGGNTREAVDVIIRAWEAYKEGFTLTEGCCYPHYATDADGKRYLVERPTFGGIDLPPAADEDDAAPAEQPAPDEVPDDEAEPAPEVVADVEKRKAQAGKAVTKALNGKHAKGDAEPPAGPALDAATVLLLRGEHKGKLLIAVEDDFCKCYAGDHKTVKGLQLGFVTEERAGGAKVAVFPEERLQEVLDLLAGAEVTAAVVRPGADGPVVEDC